MVTMDNFLNILEQFPTLKVLASSSVEHGDIIKCPLPFSRAKGIQHLFQQVVRGREPEKSHYEQCSLFFADKLELDLL